MQPSIKRTVNGWEIFFEPKCLTWKHNLRHFEKTKSRWRNHVMSLENITPRYVNKETDNIGDDPMERVDETQLELVVRGWKSHSTHFRGLSNSPLASEQLHTTCKVTLISSTFWVLLAGPPITRLSTYLKRLHALELWKAPRWKENRNDDNTAPCSTPHLFGTEDDYAPPIHVYCFRSWK